MRRRARLYGVERRHLTPLRHERQGLQRATRSETAAQQRTSGTRISQRTCKLLAAPVPLLDMKNVGRYLMPESMVGDQRFFSPHKGFSCAHAHHTGCTSCSRLGYRAIRRHGVRIGLRLLLARFGRCRAVQMNSRERAAGTGCSSDYRASAGPVHRQRGFCDALACVPCDAGCIDAPFASLGARLATPTSSA